MTRLHNSPDRTVFDLIEAKAKVSFDGADMSNRWDQIWCNTTYWGRMATLVAFTPPSDGAPDDRVLVCEKVDDQGRKWYAVVHTNMERRSLSLDPHAAIAQARALADLYPPARGWAERDEAVLRAVLHGAASPEDDDNRDPMEETGAACCPLCGEHPIAVNDPHECGPV